MKNILYTFLDKYKYLIFFVLLIASMVYNAKKDFDRYIDTGRQIGNYIAVESGDTDGYIWPMDELRDNGIYPVQESEGKILVGRGPYYGFLYFVFSLFLDKPVALDLVAIVQIILLALSITLLLKECERYIKHKGIIYFFMILILLLKPAWNIGWFIFTEAFALSCVIFFCITYNKFTESNRYLWLLLSGVFLGYASTMKPYLFPVYAIVGIIYLVANYNKLKNLIIYLCVFSAPVIIMCLPFTYHNYHNYKIFAPVQNTTWAGYKSNPAFLATREFVKSFGENSTFWDDGALIKYFYCASDSFDVNMNFPEKYIATGYTINDIENLRDSILKATSDTRSNEHVIEYVCAETERIKNLYFIEHPVKKFTYRILSFTKYAVCTHHYFSLNKDYSLRNIIRYIVRNFLSVAYYYILLLGVIGIIQCKNQRSLWAYYGIFLWIVLFFGLWSGFPESRMFVIGYYMLLPGAILFTDCIYGKYIVRK